ncbi:TenA family transcriptional regulator [Halomonas sp. V046]|uniref:TenA family transcriptional regulator n=1 Tax=Halomonas sp. V046 TaxID=3459611 RepID=UPI00404431F2
MTIHGSTALHATTNSPEDSASGRDFHEELLAATASERDHLMARPLIRRALAGELDLSEYRAFLAQAYHHVRHTLSLLMACGAQLSAPEFVFREGLRRAIAEYIDEEKGHEHWILDDLEALGVAREAASRRLPLHATEMMVAYAYDAIARRHPLCMFGMVLVLEGTSTHAATQAGIAIRDSLELDDGAFHYLFSHGELDVSHMAFFAKLMNTIDCPREQAHIVHAARAFYRLYAEVLDAALADASAWTDRAMEIGPSH